MNNHNDEHENSVDKKPTNSWTQLVFKPQIVVAFLTAIAGPWTVVKVSEGIEHTKIHSAELVKQRELQSEILTKIMEYASKENGDSTSSLQKISLLTSLVNDNKDTFGLTFPSIEDQIESKQRIERELLKKQLSTKETKLSEQKALIEAKENDLSTKRKELQEIISKQQKLEGDIKKFKVNREANIALNKELAKQRDEKQKIITTLESETEESKTKLASLEADVRIKQNEIDSLSKRVAEIVKENNQYAERIKSLTENKDADITKLKNELKSAASKLSKAISDNQLASTRIDELQLELSTEKETAKRLTHELNASRAKKTADPVTEKQNAPPSETKDGAGQNATEEHNKPIQQTPKSGAADG